MELIDFPEVGEQIHNLYLHEKLGQGSFGTVYEAFHRELREQFAVKVLHHRNVELSKREPEEVQYKARAIEHFKREARIMLKLDSHANIVRIYDLFEHNSYWCIQMELLGGGTLEDEVRKAGPSGLGVDRALEVTRHILSGLAAIHETEIIHRDLKPTNILQAADGRCKIGDFGLAMVPLTFSSDGGRYVPTGPEGTLLYMSPEQISVEGVLTPASDLYTVGVMLYEMLAGGRMYFPADEIRDFWHLRQVIVDEPPTSLDTYRKGLPTWLVDSIMKSLAKTPRERFQSAEDFLIFLETKGQRVSPPPGDEVHSENAGDEAEPTDVGQPDLSEGAPRAERVDAADQSQPDNDRAAPNQGSVARTTVNIESPRNKSHHLERHIDVTGTASGTDFVEMFHPKTGALLRERVGTNDRFCFKEVELREGTNRYTVIATANNTVLSTAVVYHEARPSQDAGAALTNLLQERRLEIGEPRLARDFAELMRRAGVGPLQQLVRTEQENPNVDMRRNAVVALSAIVPVERFLELAMPRGDARFGAESRARLRSFLQEFIVNEVLGSLNVVMNYDPATKVRSVAVLVFQMLGGEKAIGPLIEILRRDQAASVREAAAIGLGRLGARASGAIDDLAEVLESDPQLSVRASALEALGSMGHPRVVPIIRSLELDRGLRVRAQGIIDRIERQNPRAS